MSETSQGQRAHHDMGGQPAGPVQRSEHDHAFWEKRVDALLSVLSNKDHQILRVDELRRGIESLPAEAYERLDYYERWIESITGILLEKGLVTQDEIEGRIAELKARGIGQ